MSQTQYTFQQVFDEFTTQKAMFDTVAMSLVDDVLRGKNGMTVCFYINFGISVQLALYP